MTPAGRGPSRRAFLRSAGVGIAGSSGLLLSACGGSKPTKKELIAGSETLAIRASDIEVLNAMLDLEHRAVAAYTAGIPLLTGRPRAAAVRFLGQELSHVTVVSGAVKGAGGNAHLPKASYDLGEPRSQADVLALLNSVEESLVAAYLDAIPKLSPGWLRADVAAILANEGQHISLLRAARGMVPVPSAFLTGNE